MAEPGSTKAPDAFRTISEVAEDLDLPQHVLRFWETRFSQIKPMKRGGGRRYYRPEDIDLLRGIRLLLYGEGFTIRGVQRLLKEKGVGFVAEAGQRGSVEAFAPVEREIALEDADIAKAGEVDGPGLSAGRVPADRNGSAHAARAAAVLSISRERRRKLEAALSALEEAKRLLDQAR